MEEVARRLGEPCETPVKMNPQSRPRSRCAPRQLQPWDKVRGGSEKFLERPPARPADFLTPTTPRRRGTLARVVALQTNGRSGWCGGPAPTAWPHRTAGPRRQHRTRGNGGTPTMSAPNGRHRVAGPSTAKTAAPGDNRGAASLLDGRVSPTALEQAGTRGAVSHRCRRASVRGPAPGPPARRAVDPSSQTTGRGGRTAD